MIIRDSDHYALLSILKYFKNRSRRHTHTHTKSQNALRLNDVWNFYKKLVVPMTIIGTS